MHACGIKFVGINVRGTCLISENHEHLYPRNYPLYGMWGQSQLATELVSKHIIGKVILRAIECIN